MKKIFLSLVMLLGASSLMAQYQNNYRDAFKHLGYGVEVGTMGVGVDLSLPVVTDHLVLKVGYNFVPKFTVKQDFKFNTGSIDGYIEQVNNAARTANAAGYANDIHYERFNGITVGGKFKPNMSNFKVMLEYYPMSFRSFHITAGMMIGPKDMIQLSGKAEDGTWAKYQRLYNNLPADARLVGVTVSEDDLTLAYRYGGKNYKLNPAAAEGKIEANLEVNGVKPYLGIGWGSSIPRKALGFQFEIGAWFHGKPELVISKDTPIYTGNNVDADVTKDVDDIMDKVEKFQVYPQISFRLTGHIF